MTETPRSVAEAQTERVMADDAGLVQRCVRGDALALAQLIARYQDPIAGLACRLLGWQADVEDVVQDVFVAVWQNVGRFRGQSRFSTWLYRIAVNQCRRTRRRRWLRRQAWRKAARTRVPASGPVVAAAASQPEVSELVWTAVRQLPARYREVIVLRYLQELPSAEIGLILGLKPNAVEVRLNRARARLRTALGPIVQE